MKALEFEGLNSFVTLEFKNTYHKELPPLKGAQGMTSHPSPLRTRRCRKLCCTFSTLVRSINDTLLSCITTQTTFQWNVRKLYPKVSFFILVIPLIRYFMMSQTHSHQHQGNFQIMKGTCLLALQEFVKCEWSEYDLFLLEEFSKNRYFVKLTWLRFANHLLIIADSWNKIRFNGIWNTPYF